MNNPKFNVKEFVARIGITQKELAEKLGVKKETVYKWADGTNKPTFDVVYKLKKMGVSDYELFGESFAEQEELYKKRVLSIVSGFLNGVGIEKDLTKEKIKL